MMCEGEVDGRASQAAFRKIARPESEGGAASGERFLKVGQGGGSSVAASVSRAVV